MFTKKELDNHIDAGWIRVQKHPKNDLFIYNYTQEAQYEGIWDHITLSCRGLILDKNNKIVARPLPKFFNLGERDDQLIPNEAFEVFEKLDGSLGILYWIGDQPFIATRGSFQSEQSAVANEILYAQYRHLIPALDRSKTYLFEIIYPGNRIVVDYGNRTDIILLAIIDTATGVEAPLNSMGFPVVRKYNGVKDIHTLKDREEVNREGFVIRFASGLRYKVKFTEYIRIHRLVTQVSNVTIWENLKAGDALHELIEKVPDEFYEWVKQTRAELLTEFANIEHICKQEFKILATRKDTALYFQECQFPGVLFNMLDGKNYDEIIWKAIRPKHSKPFSTP